MTSCCTTNENCYVNIVLYNNGITDNNINNVQVKILNGTCQKILSGLVFSIGPFPDSEKVEFNRTLFSEGIKFLSLVPRYKSDGSGTLVVPASFEALYRVTVPLDPKSENTFEVGFVLTSEAEVEVEGCIEKFMLEPPATCCNSFATRQRALEKTTPYSIGCCVPICSDSIVLQQGTSPV